MLTNNIVNFEQLGQIMLHYVNGGNFCRQEAVALVFETFKNWAALKGKNLLPLPFC